MQRRTAELHAEGTLKQKRSSPLGTHGPADPKPTPEGCLGVSQQAQEPVRLQQQSQDSLLVGPAEQTAKLRSFGKTCWRLFGQGMSQMKKLAQKLALSRDSQLRLRQLRGPGQGCLRGGLGMPITELLP